MTEDDSGARLLKYSVSVSDKGIDGHADKVIVGHADNGIVRHTDKGVDGHADKSIVGHADKGIDERAVSPGHVDKGELVRSGDNAFIIWNRMCVTCCIFRM
jgi:hypothetical protein